MAEIASPLPGTFYHKPSPEAPAFKTPGDVVAADDTIGLIEVMKTFLEIKAEVAGVFAGYVTEDGGPVQAGDPLATVNV